MEPNPDLETCSLLSRGEACLLKLRLISSLMVASCWIEFSSGFGGESTTGDIFRCPRSFNGCSNGDDLRGRSCLKADCFKSLRDLRVRVDTRGFFLAYCDKASAIPPACDLRIQKLLTLAKRQLRFCIYGLTNFVSSRWLWNHSISEHLMTSVFPWKAEVQSGETSILPYHDLPSIVAGAQCVDFGPPYLSRQ